MNINSLLDDLYESNEDIIPVIEEALLIYAFDNLPLKDIRELDGVDVLSKDDFINYYFNEVSFSDFLDNITEEETDKLYVVAEKFKDAAIRSSVYMTVEEFIRLV